MGPFSFGMLLTFGPWERLCPFVLLTCSSWPLWGAVWKGLSGRLKEGAGSPLSLGLHRPSTLVERIFENAFS